MKEQFSRFHQECEETPEQAKIASLSCGVRTYVTIGKRLEMPSTPEYMRNRLRLMQAQLISQMGDPEIHELSSFRTWQAEQERINRWGDPHEYERI